MQKCYFLMQIKMHVFKATVQGKFNFSICNLNNGKFGKITKFKVH